VERQAPDAPLGSYRGSVGSFGSACSPVIQGPSCRAISRQSGGVQGSSSQPGSRVKNAQPREASTFVGQPFGLPHLDPVPPFDRPRHQVHVQQGPIGAVASSHARWPSGVGG